MFLIVETFLNSGEPSSAIRRVRVLPGQGVDPDVRVSCSMSMRHQFELGQLFLLDVQWKYVDDCRDCLYANPNDVPHPVSKAAARKYIKDNLMNGSV